METPATANDERLLRWATTCAVLVATLLVFTKLGAFLLTQSVSVLASLLDSLMDVGASFINLLAVRYSLQPPDAEHRFGHGKAESIAAMVVANLTSPIRSDRHKFRSRNSS